MIGSTIIDVAIGIVFLFLLVSLFASTLNEIVLSFLNMRGRDLLRGLKELLGDKHGTGLVQQLYSHGLIFGLFKGDYTAGKGGNLPSYIPARSFALAMMDLIPKLSTAQAGSTPAAPTPGAPTPAAPQPSYVASAAVSGARGATATINPDQPNDDILEPLRKAVLNLDPKVRGPLLAMIDAAEKDPSNLRQNLENWFNSTMDRVSGWYKYRTQWFLFGIGMVLAATMNIDTLVIARHLSTDSSLRQALVAAASDAAKQPLPRQISTPDQAAKAQAASATATQPNTQTPPSSGASDGTGSKQSAQTMDLDQLTAKIAKLGLPIGWPEPQEGKSVFEMLSWYMSLAPQHLGGWFLTALAASLGAPFWFDILNKFMVVRSTVKPREKSHDEKAKDN